MTGFQQTVNAQPAPGIEGDFATADPRATVLIGPGAFVAAAAGLIVGRFGWGNQTTGLASNTFDGVGTIGFVHRDVQALITQYLAESSMTIPQGFMATLFSRGAFWGRFAAGAVIGQKVFANFLTGLLTSAAAGTSTTEATGTGVIAVTTGILTISGSPTGTWAVGQIVSGTGVPAGTRITALGTGTGGAGTYQTNITTAVSSTAVTGASRVETNWTVYSTAGNGEVAMISTWG